MSFSDLKTFHGNNQHYSYLTTMAFATAIFLSSSVMGILTGVKDSVKGTDSDSFDVGYSFQMVLVVALLVAWIMIMSKVHGASMMTAAITALVFAFVGIGWGGMMGYRTGMKDPSNKAIEAAFIMIPIGVFAWAMFSNYVAINSAGAGVSHGMKVIMALLVGALFMIPGAILIAKEDMKSGVKAEWYKAYAGIMIGAGALLLAGAFGLGGHTAYKSYGRGSVTGKSSSNSGGGGGGVLSPEDGWVNENSVLW